MSENRFDVLVVGGGPAGIAAAVSAAECGADVAIVDENPTLGGQIWRGSSNTGLHPDAEQWKARLYAAKVAPLCGKRIFHQPETGVLLAEGDDEACELRYHQLVLATGARERFLPFPGWTLPNVMGAGALQAMVKSGLPIRGKSITIAGTGPLLLAVAAFLRSQGADIAIICEQASWRSLMQFGASLAAFPEEIGQALQLRRALRGIPFTPNSWPLIAHGTKRVESVTISRGGRRETIGCDYLACGFHLAPNVELPVLLGCETVAGYVRVDELQRTTVDRVYCAGEPTGIGGVELAIVEGQIAGLAAAGRADEARKLFGQRRAARRFAHLLDRTFRLRPELKRLPEEETLICRCEDIPYSGLRTLSSWRAAKLQTRCGMGPCQGRVCGLATEFFFNWKPDSVRPPVLPARVESLAADASQSSVSGGMK
jgi:NADPH-dependent 2,4-dienoyl-CoA reductase/sulfur reductase-like enzyme